MAWIERVKRHQSLRAVTQKCMPVNLSFMVMCCKSKEFFFIERNRVNGSVG